MERYRIGARRRGGLPLDPVYVVSEPARTLGDPQNGFTGIGRDRTINVYTGTQGLLAVIRPWHLGLPPRANTGDGGMLGAMLGAIASNSGGTVTYSATNTSNSFVRLEEEINLVASHLIDDYLYLFVARCSYCQAYREIEVLYRRTVQTINGAQVDEFNYFVPAWGVMSAKHDLVCIRVNLDTEAVDHTVAPLYSTDITVNSASGGVVIIGGSSPIKFKYSKTTDYAGLRQALNAVLPSTHPFKQCAPNAFSYFQNGSHPIGGLSYTTPTSMPNTPTVSEYQSFPRLTSNKFDTANVINPIYSSIGVDYDIPNIDFYRAGRFFDRLASGTGVAKVSYDIKGHSTQGARVIAAYGQQGYPDNQINEFSQLSQSWRSCDGLALLHTMVEGSFASYSSGNLTNREDLLDVSGLDAIEGNGIIFDPLEPAPPSQIFHTGPSGFAFSDAIYFREAATGQLPAYMQSPDAIVREHYRINR